MLKSVLTLIIMAWGICHSVIAIAQTYKWVDDEGRTHYSDDPKAARKSASVQKMEKHVSAPAVNSAVSKGASAKSAAIVVEEERAAVASGEVVLAGEFEINHSASGRAVIETALQNQSDQPVDGVSLKVVLFLAGRGPTSEIVIPLKGGKKKTSGLKPGETGKIEYETDYAPEEVVGYTYKVKWAVMAKKPSEKGAVVETPGEPGSVKEEDKPEQKPMNRFRRNVENKRKRQLEQSEKSEKN